MRKTFRILRMVFFSIAQLYSPADMELQNGQYLINCSNSTHYDEMLSHRSHFHSNRVLLDFIFMSLLQFSKQRERRPTNRASPARGQSCSGAETGPLPALQSSPLSCGTSQWAPSILLAHDQTHLGHFDVITVKCIVLQFRPEEKRNSGPWMGWITVFSLSADPPDKFDCTHQSGQLSLALFTRWATAMTVRSLNRLCFVFNLALVLFRVTVDIVCPNRDTAEMGLLPYKLTTFLSFLFLFSISLPLCCFLICSLPCWTLI